MYVPIVYGFLPEINVFVFVIVSRADSEWPVCVRVCVCVHACMHAYMRVSYNGHNHVIY